MNFCSSIIIESPKALVTMIQTIILSNNTLIKVFIPILNLHIKEHELYLGFICSE